MRKQKANIKSKMKTLEEDTNPTEYDRLVKASRSNTKSINKLKGKLLDRFAKSVEYNNVSGNKKIRQLSETAIIDKNIISVFESTLTRTLGLKANDLSTDIFVVKVYYFDIIQDLILNGFEYQGEKYRYFTSSAGQIRTKKTVFIKECLWNKYEKVLMCGLTVDSINKFGGINVNKYLAYLALSNSATDVWEDFDIRKCIVVDDFETMVNGDVDFIDDTTYEIKRVNMDIPIEHTDGCGMILPSLSVKNFMIRLPWIKGLLASFDFVKFIKEHNCNGVVKDIYGKYHNIIDDDIQVIFTKSQFKMHQYYKDWKSYTNSFINYECQAGICNVEEDYIPNASINYQMMQTLTDMTDDELRKIAKFSIEKLNNLATTVKSMLEAFNVTKYNTNKTYLQQAIEIYPELLSDIYAKEVLRGIKKSMIKRYKSAKLNIKGKYMFLVPDLYAFCEYLFLGDKTPKGLLGNGEVYCRLYKRVDKLDCLRSPHLAREHAVRKNVTDDVKNKWFNTNAIYTSCHDLISKILQFDVDGDMSLVVADSTIVKIAERNMQDIVPLYYDMKKAEPVKLTNESIYRGLNAAFTGGNIGAISNDITKIWNSEHVGGDELNAIKILCMENNYVIDYAKTLYKPTRPSHIDEIIKKYTNSKPPHFFIYAKDKQLNQVEEINNSVVNRLDKLIKGKNLRFNIKEFGKLDYKMLMNNPDIVIDHDCIDAYTKLNRKYHFKINMKNSVNSNISYIASEIRSELSKFMHNDYDIVDMLIKHLYWVKNSKSKESLWFCYGDIIVENLKRNIGEDTAVCQKCGKRFNKETINEKYCLGCRGYIPIKTKTITCIDCGKEVIVDSKNTTQNRCSECYKIYRNNYQKELMRNKRKM